MPRVTEDRGRSTVRSARRAEAIRQVRFDLKRLDAVRPNTEELQPVDSNLGRRSTQNFSTVGDFDDTPPAPAEASEHEHETYEKTYATFQEACAEDAFLLHRYTISMDDLEGQDLRCRVETYAEMYTEKKEAPGMPFAAVADTAMVAWPDIQRTIDQGTFERMFKEDPQALWLEFKTRAFMMMAHRDQIIQLHNTCKNLDSVVEGLHSWAHFFGKEYAQRMQGVVDPLTPQDNEDVAALIEEVNDGRQKIDELKEDIQDMARRLRQSRTDSQTTDRSSVGHDPGTLRSTRAPDPPVFTNDKDSTVHFGPWLMLVKGKMQTNADHFGNDHPAAFHPAAFRQLGLVDRGAGKVTPLRPRRRGDAIDRQFHRGRRVRPAVVDDARCVRQCLFAR